MSFIDEVKVYLKAGNGGSGAASFRREKYVEFGGPDGGNGGKGGDIIFVADQGLNTLLNFRYNQHIKAPNGKNGAGRDRSGPSGEDIIIKVPVGTQVIEEDTIIADVDEINKQFLIAKGGSGGIGNSHFKTSTNRAPRHFTCGQKGEEKYVVLKLKILSDVGIIGLPNAGKSTFLTRCSHARPKVDNYPFTTLRPYLGVASIDDEEIVIADIPGLIANAHLGVGLGHKFLKHIERCQVLLHLIDCTSDDVLADYKCIRNELMLYNESLMGKKEVVVLNKCDLLDAQAVKAKKSILNNCVKEVYALSLNDDLKPVLRLLNENLKNSKVEITNQVFDPYKYS
ncbi:Obg family GTPase CgtA [Candidatus Mesenet endosymbiont of Phosphuga atrata]|uniref:Obg family GTPase CgtA n=1 Tax=Candidatus Mesenet endosymbiont of Phosphuga atrata TaxID=3066221 RepID=UPI0030CB9BD6